MVGTAAARVDDDALARQAGTRPSDKLLLADGVNRAAGDAGAEEIQRAQRLRAADAIRRHAVFARDPGCKGCVIYNQVTYSEPNISEEQQRKVKNRSDNPLGEK